MTPRLFLLCHVSCLALMVPQAYFNTDVKAQTAVHRSHTRALLAAWSRLGFSGQPS